MAGVRPGRCMLCDFQAVGPDDLWKAQRLFSHMVEAHNAVLGSTAHAASALGEFLEEAGVDMDTVVPPETFDWEAAYQTAANDRARLIVERDRLAAEVCELDVEVERLERITEVDRPSTAVIVVMPNDEINAVLDLVERYPHMGDPKALATTGSAVINERAARRWRAAVVEQAG